MKTKNIKYKFSKQLGVFVCLASLLTACGGGNENVTETSKSSEIITASVSDMNGDGKADIVIEDSNNLESMPWHFGTSTQNQFDASDSLTQTFDLNVDHKAKAIAVADANGDGKNDVLVQLDSVDGHTHWKVFLSNGTSSSEIMGDISLPSGNDARALAFTDINADGYADILLQQQIDGIIDYYVSLSNGTEYSTPFSLYRFRLGKIDWSKDFLAHINSELGRPELVALKDVNNDGTADLVFDRQNYNHYQGHIEHCYFVRTFSKTRYESRFEKLDIDDNCYKTSSEFVGIADITGNGIAELILDGEGLLYLVDGTTGSEWSRVDPAEENLVFLSMSIDYSNDLNISTKPADYIDYITGPVFIEPASPLDPYSGNMSYKTIASTDLNNDGKIDILREVTKGNVRYWQALIATGNKTFEAQIWLTGNITDTAFAVRDYNNDGLPDLLVNAPYGYENRDRDGDGYPDFIPKIGTPISTNLYVKINDGSSFKSNDWELWYQHANQVRVIGVEDYGLTTIAKDTSALISWSGMSDSPRYTQNEFKEVLKVKGLNLITKDRALNKNECQAVYSSSDNKDLSAEFATLVCNVELVPGVVSIKSQPLYGGCDVARSGNLIGGLRCEVGVFKYDLEVNIGPVTRTLTLAGPKVGACGAISAEFTCVRAGTEVVSATQTLMVGDTGVGAGVSVGFGAGGSLSTENGVLSGELDLKGGLGISIKFSFDYEATGDFIIDHGETAFVFVADNAGIVVKSAGVAIVSTLNAIDGVVVDGVGEGIEFVNGAVTSVGGVFEDIGDAFCDFFGC